MAKLVVLASGSPRRRHLLEGLGLQFIVDPADVEHGAHVGDDETPAEYARRLAYTKAVAVSPRHPDCVVLGADTVVVLDDRVLEKPQTVAEARHMLRRLAGRTHHVITAFALIDAASGTITIGHESTRVKVRELNPELIATYVATGEPMDKAGSYAIQGLGSALVERVEGCFYNVVGLPVPRVVKELEDFGIRPQDYWAGLDRRVKTDGVT